ncbi:MAG: DUF805 domain-containing protein [Planctomycetaceae bacterium]|jgi:uncharacterized membrane protein YhaH (DUF805 family)|nr:DUF805 domain-containing protein [Planctomycetaceae bacterium]
MNKNNVSDCPICGNPVESDKPCKVCPSCKLVFHQKCWLENNLGGIGFWEVITQKYSLSKGRARRKEFWWFFLCYWSFIVNIWVFAAQLNDVSEIECTWLLSLFVWIFTVVTLVPYINLCIRRMHDIGQSGWLVLINSFPMIGPFIFLILCAINSQKGTNQYGPNPKE